MSHAEPASTLYGLMAEFETPGELVAAATKARLAGYRQMDAYSPIPVEALDEALGLKRSKLPLLVLLGGIAGGIGGFGLEAWASTTAYPMNIGGRPLLSWPQFIPVMFETTVLGAALTCFIGMWALNKLPQPYHPVFNAPAFARASSDRFFIVIETADPRYSSDGTRQFLDGLHPVGVHDVAP